jgi:hypothetical protein
MSNNGVWSPCGSDCSTSSSSQKLRQQLLPMAVQLLALRCCRRRCIAWIGEATSGVVRSALGQIKSFGYAFLCFMGGVQYACNRFSDCRWQQKPEFTCSRMLTERGYSFKHLWISGPYGTIRMILLTYLHIRKKPEVVTCSRSSCEEGFCVDRCVTHAK